MIYPLLPLFLTRVLGAGAMSLGVIEGVAEAANSVLKIVSGRLADRTRRAEAARARRLRTLVGACGRSSRSRRRWTHVLALRFTDRLGKGIRGAPRDAMLAHFAHAPIAAASSASIAPWITPAPSSVRCSRRCFSTSIPASIERSSR